MNGRAPASHFFTEPGEYRQALDEFELGTRARRAMNEESSFGLGPHTKVKHPDDPTEWAPMMRHRWFVVAARARHAVALAREWTEAEQDAEQRALRNLSAPVPIPQPIGPEYLYDAIGVGNERLRRAGLLALDPDLRDDIPGFRHVGELA